MIEYVDIRDFQSHKDTLIRFSPNVTLLTGTTNSGKSAAVRSLIWLLQSKPKGDGFIREGSDEASVIAKVNGVEVERFRNKKSNGYRYVKDGEEVEFTALGGDIPIELSTVFNITDVNIQSQLSPHFLILDTPAKIGKYINDITGTNEISDLISLSTAKIKKSNVVTETLQQELNEVSSELKYLEVIDVEELTQLVNKLDKLEDYVNSTRISHDELWETAKTLMDTIKRTTLISKDIYSYKDTLVGLKDLVTKSTISVRCIKENLRNLHNYSDNIDKYPNNFDSECSKLFELDDRYYKNSKVISKIKEFLEASTKVTNIPDNLEKLKKNIFNWRKSQKTLYIIIDEYNKAINDLKMLDVELNKVTESISENDMLIKEYTKKIAKCPYCNQNLSVEAKAYLLN